VVLTLSGQLHPWGSQRIWVAARPIAAGHVITGADVRAADSLVTWPSLLVDSDEIIGRSATHDLDLGEPFTRRTVLAPATLLGTGRVAMTVEVSAGDARLVRSGDRVDVLASDGEGSARVVASRAVVTATSADNVIVVAVLPGEALTLAGSRDAGGYALVLRP
jgi:Flp pilus assembly protein CpaB